MAEWIGNDSWFASYAQGSISSKPPSETMVEMEEVEIAITEAFRNVYRAVAFDIDGTLTEREQTEINPQMARIIGRLLQRGVPVFLITGRGRSSSREVAREIKKISGLSDWYMRRLQCITHNGVFLIRTPTEDPQYFLSQERLLADPMSNLEGLYDKVLGFFNDYKDKHNISRVDFMKEPHSIRLVFDSEAERKNLEEQLQDFISGINSTQNFDNIFLSRGSYGKKSCLDLSATNKKLALERVSQIIGVSPNKILRIGDRGEEGGNDYDLLDSVAGFSVGGLSPYATRCHPVLGEDMQTQLHGIEATNRLLNLVLLFPALSLKPKNPEKIISAHKSFEKLALRRSREEGENVTQQIRLRLRYAPVNSSGFTIPRSVTIADIYDQFSGGVFFRDWEFDALGNDHKLLELFDIYKLLEFTKKEPSSKWSMYTDTGILMRGPNYYYCLTFPPTKDSIPLFLEIFIDFINRAIDGITFVLPKGEDFGTFKLLLAIKDNVRNMLLRLFYISFLIDMNSDDRNFDSTRSLLTEGLSPHTRYHYNFLLNPEIDSKKQIEKYSEFLVKILNDITKKKEIIITESLKIPQEQDVFKWRECDHFLQNITAIQLGFHELRQREEIWKLEQLIGLGLAHGGIEMPIIAHEVARLQKVSMEIGILEISRYSKEAREKIQEGDEEYLSELLTKKKPLFLSNESRKTIRGESCILMDDNCTTCATLQYSRDFLLLQGADVVGAIIIRFPGVNRQVHMALPTDGFPDPDVLFSFIRGLIAPSPYARLIEPHESENPYIDQTELFDKSKARIQRYLLKNGTPPLQ